MTFEEASSTALNAAAELSAILHHWILMGHVIYIMPATSIENNGASYAPSVEVHVVPDLAPREKREILQAVEPIADEGVPVTMIWGSESLGCSLTGTVH
jgi:hypothetical protein